MGKKMSVNEKEYEILKLLGKRKGGYSYLTDDGIKKYVLRQICHFLLRYKRSGHVRVSY